MINKTQGIVVNQFTSGNHLITRVITKDHGKLVFFVLQGKKSAKRFGKLDLFDHGEFSYEDRSSGLPALKEFKASSSYPEIRENIDKITVAAYLAEIYDLLTPENDPLSIEQYLLLESTLRSICKTSETKNLLKIAFSSSEQLLKYSGIQEDSKRLVPSVKNLKQVILKIEIFSGRPLKTKPQVELICQSL